MSRLLLLITIISFIMLPCGCRGGDSALILKDYPQIFSEATIIITGNQTSSLEIETADVIADNLMKETGNEVAIIDITGINEAEKTENNLIILIPPDSNPLIAELLEEAGISAITSDYPGESKGILEIATNPWNEEYVVMAISGSDKWGLKVAVLVLEDLKLRRTSEMVVEWENYTGVKFPIDTESEAIKFAKLDHDVRAYIDYLHEKEYGVSLGVHYHSSSQEWSVGIEATKITDTWMEIRFLPDGTITFKGEGSI